MGELGDGGPAVAAALDQPHGVAVDAHGNTLIADSVNNVVRVVAVSASNPGYPLAGCAGVCTWTVGTIYIIAGHYLGGYNGDRIPATTAQLFAPTDVAVDAAGNPIIADSLNERVRAWSRCRSPIPAIRCRAGRSATSTPSWATVPAPCTTAATRSYATDAQLDSPGKVTVDADGNALLADTGNNRVRVVAVSVSNPGYLLGGCTGPCTWIRGYIYTVAGTGFAGYNGDFLPATGADLNGPTGIAVDARGNLDVSDTNNHRLRVCAVSSSNPGFPLASWTAGDIYTIAGNSGAGYSGDGFLAASVQINGAQGVTVDTHGNPLIADTGDEASGRRGLP